ncbi:hypothetical protein ACH0B5_05750 [Ureibacillus sp. 179-F W5.1 NHS]|nr:hypothetical protein [Lysinibacillus halotolerans]
MRKTIPLILLLGVFFFGMKYENVYSKKDSPQPMEEFYPEIGYKTVEAATKDFEKHFKKELKLPLRVPPISFTHQFGRFSNMNGEMNDHFELTMISDQSPQHHYKIEVRPIKYKIPFVKHISEVFKLKNGSEASYVVGLGIGFNLFVFERDGWQYVLSIDSDVGDKVPPEVLVQIANSIDYTTKVETY